MKHHTLKSAHPRAPGAALPEDLDIHHRELCAVLSYDPTRGTFTWRVAPSPRCKVGSAAGSLDRLGYPVVHWRNRSWSEAQLAVFYMRGEFPKGRVRRTVEARHCSPFETLMYTLADGRTYIGSQEVV